MNNDKTLLSELLVTAHRLTRIAAQALGSTTPSAVWHTLSILSTDGPLRIGELASIARVSQPSMTKVVQQLIGDNLADRIVDPDDSRASLITVLPAGVNALANWRQALATALQPMFSGLTADDRKTLTRAVDILSARTSSQKAAA